MTGPHSPPPPKTLTHFKRQALLCPLASIISGRVEHRVNAGLKGLLHAATWLGLELAISVLLNNLLHLLLSLQRKKTAM